MPSSSSNQTATINSILPPVPEFFSFQKRNTVIMDVWSWICELPESESWNENGENSLSFELATHLRHSMKLKAERTLAKPSDDDSSEASLLLSFSLQYFSSSSPSNEEADPKSSETTLWVSEKCNLSQDQPFLPLVLQILQEIISRAPNYPGYDCSSCPRSQLQTLKPEPVSWILDSHSQESFSSFFNLIFLTRLFWLCVFEAPSEVGSLYFRSLLSPNLETFSCKHAPVLKTFFLSVGTDVELCFMRTFSYMLAKSLLFRDIGMGALTPAKPTSVSKLGVSYATESHGMWILKGYIPVNAMDCVVSNRRPNVEKNPFYTLIEPKESVLKYTLAHQQLEAVIQFEYKAAFCDGFIQVQANLDNIRLHVVKLGFKNKGDGSQVNEEDVLLKEKHFPSRVRVWVGPEVGANYVGSLSLGRSTDNVEREVEMQKILQGSLGKVKVPKVKGKARMASKTKLKNWRWDQDVDGNAAVFDGILCDNTTGAEIATWKPPSGGGDNSNYLMMVNNFARRYSGGNRAFTKSGGVVFAGAEEFGGGGENGGGGVGWRLSKDMEGSVLKWRIGVQVWLSYFPNDVKASYFETRMVDWCDEVDLPLIPSKHT
ncbi:OLC1v1000117C1 [Oldenlandia corymbosa var. corymbosa]|uniref:OLC1v1000117C1 n=1 Tax=Oldenlandia corymbosa var. corymbosa TaxID=529605 RepID=A0AAV1D3L6_OLDCO|nr:OLC1v1000117C1 [Oldenlandia corymbosa var. corymbosa]